MTPTRLTVIPLLLALAGCNSLDGWFTPSCVAFAGERIELSNGRFEWQRFTDERRIDQDGNVIDPLPDYPKRGDYRVVDGRVEFLSDEGIRLEDRYLVERSDGLYLLAPAAWEAFAAGGGLPDCPLRYADAGG